MTVLDLTVLDLTPVELREILHKSLSMLHQSHQPKRWESS